MRRLSPIEALKPQARQRATAWATAPAALVPHWRGLSLHQLLRQRQQTWTSTTTSNKSRTSLLAPTPLHRHRFWSSRCMSAAAAAILQRPSVPGAMASAYSAYHGPAAAASQFTTTALGRWSVLTHPLPGLFHAPLG
jgi:hypothetical protein